LGVLVDNNEVAGGKTSMGMEENIEGLLCYVFGWVTGVIFLIAEKNSLFVKFHAWQSLLFSIATIVIYWVVGMIPGVRLILMVLWIPVLILWIILLMKAYKGETYKLPLIGDIAYKQAYGS
jgi:uncharacterized membrane protein